MEPWRDSLLEGQVIPACPLALTQTGEWSPRHQRALVRYYLDAGVGGIAVGVHTTQFEIRNHGLYEPVLRCISNLLDEEASTQKQFIRIAGLCGSPEQVVAEAKLAANLGFHLGLLSPSGFHGLSEAEIIQHTKDVAEIIPVFGFYLQPAVGGRSFSIDYWHQLTQIKNLLAIKVAAFNRYQTIDVMCALEASKRPDLAVYTGNDDQIILDLLTAYQFNRSSEPRWMVGGLLGQWAIWTREAVKLFEKIKQARLQERLDRDWLNQNAKLTAENAVIFDAQNQFSGCIPGINEVLRRQGLLPSSRCLNINECLSLGQSDEIDRIEKNHLEESSWIRAHLDKWLQP